MSNIENNTVATETNAAPVVAKKAPGLKKLAQFQTPDGQIFETQKAASEHLRKHLKVEAVNAIAAEYTGVDADGNEQSLGDFLLANEDRVRKAFDANKTERAPITEATRLKMKIALELRQAKAKAAAIEAAGGTVPADLAQFIADNTPVEAPAAPAAE